MACEALCIYGESGTGKTTSLRNMNPESTFIISTTGKPLSFKGWKKKYIPFKIDKETKKISGNYYVSSNSEQMRDDCTMCFLTHADNVGTDIDPKYVIKTIGKLLSEKVTLEGLFTYIFFTKVEEGDDGKMQYRLVTNNDGKCLAKTPMGMFEELEIDNDLNEILKVIKEYNED